MGLTQSNNSDIDLNNNKYCTRLKLCDLNILDNINDNDKYYFIPIKLNNIIILYLITFKLINNNLFLYVNNKLIHVFEEENNTEIIKYIQISNDFEILTIPENNLIYFYNVNELIENNILKLKFNVMINIKEFPQLEIIENSENNKKYKYENFNQYKSILSKNKYIIISHNNQKYYNYIIICDLNIKKTKILNINHEIINSKIILSENGDNLLLYNNKDNFITHINLNTFVKNKIYDDFINLIHLNTLNILDDGETLIALTKDNKIKLLTLTTSIEYICNNILNNFTMNIFDYTKIIEDTDKICDKIYILTLWNKTDLFIYTIIKNIKNNTFEINENKLDHINFNNKNKIDFIHKNCNYYIYKYEKYIEIYDIKKLFVFVILDKILDLEIKRNKECEWKYYNELENNHYCVNEFIINNKSRLNYNKIEIFNNILKMENTKYTQYLIIKILLNYYESNLTKNEKSEIIILFNKLTLIRKFIINSVKYIYGINLLTYF